MAAAPTFSNPSHFPKFFPESGRNESTTTFATTLSTHVSTQEVDVPGPAENDGMPQIVLNDDFNGSVTTFMTAPGSFASAEDYYDFEDSATTFGTAPSSSSQLDGEDGTERGEGAICLIS